ncbi:hypothetical protein FRX31_019913 [Thalictrum thalictroides]|uniref:Uncharacterized protein n=1 Tax=Thalictrum thalictroides TaxID=46969 RepID=A0A7J6W169_THATH|nr:hypothetical protein FRX31_019913 [Thalictrum thalictroides]
MDVVAIGLPSFNTRIEGVVDTSSDSNSGVRLVFAFERSQPYYGFDCYSLIMNFLLVIPKPDQFSVL